MKWLIMGALLAGALGGGEASAADAVYQLNPVVVTAQRSVSEDLKTPAAVQVLTAEDLQKTGATSVHEALKFSTGILIHAQGPRNISQGTMTNKAVIRGVEKGTLVLVDGVPLNQGGRYNLEDVPVESVDRVEVVRGGGAVLYGSEANGGVINIITKGKRANLVRAGFGNYGIQNYAASLQAGKLGFTASYDHTGKIDGISSPESGKPAGMYYNIIRGEHANFNGRYDFNDKLFLSHTYGRNSDHYVYRYDGRNGKNPGADYKHVLHSTEENVTTLHYDDGDLKASLFYNRRDQKTRNTKTVSSPTTAKYDPSKTTSDSSGYLDETFGLDVSNRWHFEKGSFMIGYSFEREMEDKTTESTLSTKHSYDRNTHSIYGQLAYDFTKSTRANFNFRETMTGADSNGRNKVNKFTPEFILMHDFDEQTMAYAKVGKSFVLPTFSQLYGGGVVKGNKDLAPASGVHYELGLKKNIGKNAWRLALYHYKIDDSQEAKLTNPNDPLSEVYYVNENVKNTGVEIEWARNQNENLSYQVGLTFSHPEKQERDKTGITGDWHDYYGKVGINAGVNYTSGKLTSSFHISYLGDRTRDGAPYASMKAQCFSDLNFSYQANENSRFFLNIDNVFNRKDIVSSSTSSFYNLGRNFMAGYEYKF